MVEATNALRKLLIVVCISLIMVKDTLLAAGALIVLGGLFSIYHVTKLYPKFDKSPEIRYRVTMAFVGGFMISIGSNLVADAIHETVEK